MWQREVLGVGLMGEIDRRGWVSLREGEGRGPYSQTSRLTPPHWGKGSLGEAGLAVGSWAEIRGAIMARQRRKRRRSFMIASVMVVRE